MIPVSHSKLKWLVGFSVVFVILLPFVVKAQEKETTKEKSSIQNQVSSITPLSGSHFMGSSLIHMPSTENIGKQNLIFRFQHRFNDAKGGFNSFYGLDGGANTQLALDYGVTDRWMVGIARTSEKKTWEARTKFRLLSQDNGQFLNVSFFGVAGYKSQEESLRFNYFNLTPTPNTTVNSIINENLNEYELTARDRTSYLSSILISRKLHERLSIQISPMYVHQNFAKYNLSNDQTGIDIGGRFKISKRVDLVFEAIFTQKRDYFGDNYKTESNKTSLPGVNKLTENEINAGIQNGSLTPIQAYARNVLLSEPVKHYFVPASLGLDIDTGGHIFQIFVSNTRALAHTQLLRGAELNYMQKEWALGFNILRQFSFGEETW